MPIPSKIIPFKRQVYPALASAQGTEYPRFEAERARPGLPLRITPGSKEKHEQHTFS
ncbi:hypothetical protein [Devosia sp.]|uniref:hypothetical protein n=1 Tax=Devosia sp. TaxID=1871048 RepID=UPI002AFF25B6|nr:hypothetical protein [Devosia sp.]